MKLKSEIKNCALNYLDERKHKNRLRAEIVKFEDSRRKKIYESVTLTQQQKDEIDDIYIRHYGKRIPYTWHRYYSAYTGNFDPFFVPELLYIPEIEYCMNSNKNYVSVFEDKNILTSFAAGIGIKMPKTIVSSSNGILRNENLEIIDWKIAKKLCEMENVCFAKPTIDSGSGKGCILIDTNQEQYMSTIKNLGKDFVVQERISCSESIRRIYPKSVNTFRVITYIWNGKVWTAPVIMRIGRNGGYLDNAHAGGIFIAVDNDGTLHKTAFTEFRKCFNEHPDTHLKFEGYMINNFGRVLESATKMHAAIPQLGIVNWDFTIDQNENPILIEANISDGSIWLPQIAWGVGAFGENTISILEWLKEKNKR